MRGVPTLLLAGLLIGSPVAVRAATRQPSQTATTADLPIIEGLRIEGATIFTPDEIERRFRLSIGARLPQPVDELGKDIQAHYARDGYTFARVAATMNEAGVLRIAIDEGQIDEIEFRGVDADVASRFRDEFGFKPGDVFNKTQANRALQHAIDLSQGAIARDHGGEEPSTPADSREVRRDHPFTMIVDQGRHILQVNLQSRTQRSGVFVGTQGREDWYSPVDGFAPAIGFQSTIFDRHGFNHTYWAGFVSYKFAPERTGWALGFERPFLRDAVLQVGASIQDLTASDDRWRLTDVEQSLVAFTFRNTFRDYYRRKGFQVHAAVRPWAEHEWLVAWRDESHFALINETDYGLFRDSHDFRENAPAQPGTLHALLLGYTYDSRGLTTEAPGQRYRRHQMDDLFGSWAERDHGVRIEWRSEIAPAAFDHAFDFTRHVLNARTWLELSPSRLLSGRLLTGFGTGELPPQRIFALGGIGSVHGYSFKEEAGERMLLLNAEVRQRFGRSGLGGLAFIDAGRVYDPLPGSTGKWLTGVGLGIEMGSTTRVEFGWRLNDIPQSLQVLFRLTPTF